MTVTVFIRYQLDPFKHELFDQSSPRSGRFCARWWRKPSGAGGVASLSSPRKQEHHGETSC